MGTILSPGLKGLKFPNGYQNKRPEEGQGNTTIKT